MLVQVVLVVVVQALHQAQRITVQQILVAVVAQTAVARQVAVVVVLSSCATQIHALSLSAQDLLAQNHLRQVDTKEQRLPQAQAMCRGHRIGEYLWHITHF
jgi:hypothetical protein